MKTYTIIFSPNALSDIEAATEYYNLQKTGLGKRFATQVQETLKSIRNNPYFASIRYRNIRCAKINVFPFMIHYNIDEVKLIVNILSVYNTYREQLG